MKKPITPRQTKVRQALISLFSENCGPLSLAEIKKKLKVCYALSPNKSTLYREFRFLALQGIIRELALAGQKKYENNSDHHHHLICLNCKTTVPVKIGGDIKNEEKRLGKSSGFDILRHELEFYGLCRKCK